VRLRQLDQGRITIRKIATTPIAATKKNTNATSADRSAIFAALPWNDQLNQEFLNAVVRPRRNAFSEASTSAGNVVSVASRRMRGVSQ
jgi:7,8-dihydro-6-hydroxymethylpterin-pyrophosphokinase